MNPVPSLGGVAEQTPRLAQLIVWDPESGQTALGFLPEEATGWALCVDRCAGWALFPGVSISRTVPQGLQTDHLVELDKGFYSTVGEASDLLLYLCRASEQPPQLVWLFG